MSELIPGTGLPIYEPAAGQQVEGRGDVQLTHGRMPPSVLERIASRDGVSAAEVALIEAALRSFDTKKRLLNEIYDSTGRVTDSTTGNCVIPLFTAPAGTIGQVTQCTVDVPGSATITPSAPYANASSWAFVAVGNIGTTGITNAQATALRPALAGFAPTSAAGPILPGQWTWSDKNCPLAQANETVYYVLVGGSIAGVLGISLQVTYRIRLIGLEGGHK